MGEGLGVPPNSSHRPLPFVAGVIGIADMLAFDYLLWCLALESFIGYQ